MEYDEPGGHVFRDEPLDVFGHIGQYFSFKSTQNPNLTPFELKLIKGGSES